MCTVTYIPTGVNQFIFTSNRDEAPKRSATEMVQESQNEKALLFPRDALAKGTWIAVSEKNQLVCILNGAFVKHKHLPPYRLSRGIMALDFFKYKNAIVFFEKYDFVDIEPFTMIIYDDGELYEFRWDESKKHIKKLNTSEQHLWASCTLYSEEWQEKRRLWFSDWNEKYKVIDQAAVLDFHKNGGEGNEKFDVVMNWENKVRTTSITSIVKKEDEMKMRYEEILNGEIEEHNLKINPHGLFEKKG